MKLKSVVDERGFITYQAEDNYPLVIFQGAISASQYIGLPIFQITGSWSGSMIILGSLNVSGTISASNYQGIPVGSGSVVADYGATSLFHEPCVYAGGNSTSPGQLPTPTAFGPLITSVYTLNDPTERGYRIIKIPTSYVSSASFHVHWTKSGNTNESGKNVRWRVVYSVFNGASEIANVSSNSLEFEQTYLTSSTTDRVVYRTPNMDAVGFQPGYYCSMYIEATTPTGSVLTNKPALVGLDLLYRVTLNQGN